MDDHGLAALEAILDHGDPRPAPAVDELLVWAHHRAHELLRGLAADDELRAILDGAPLEPPALGGASAPERVVDDEAIDGIELIDDEDFEFLLDESEDDDADAQAEITQVRDAPRGEGEPQDDGEPGEDTETPRADPVAAESGVNPYTIDLSDLD